MLFLYDKMDDPRIPGKLLFNDDDNASLPLHWHANVEICYFLQGGFRAHIDGQSYQVQNEDLLLVNSWQIHHVGKNSVGEHRGISLVADMEFWRSVCPNLDQLEFRLDRAPDRLPELKRLMEELYNVSCTYDNAENAGDEATCNLEVLRLHSIICSIYYMLTRYFSEEKAEVPEHRQMQRCSIQDVIEYINVHYTEPLRLRDVAEAFNVSGEHLSRLFRKELNLTFKEYLYSVRMTYACKLLSYSDKSLLEVAMDAGFPDLRAFSQQFDRAYHTTPKEYRRQFRQV